MTAPGNLPQGRYEIDISLTATSSQVAAQVWYR